MRRRRWWIDAAAGLSLLLCLMTAGLWVRSYLSPSHAVWHPPVHPPETEDWLSLRSRRGEIRLVRSVSGVHRSSVVPGTPPFGRPIHPAVVHGEGPSGSWGLERTVSGTGASLVIKFPYWFPVMLSGLPAGGLGAWAWRLRQGERRRTRDLCPACGYDLRATPARCPECGAVAVARQNAN